MANVMRWRYGDTSPVMMAVDADTVIEIGDLLWLDTDDVKPASAQADQGSEGINQEFFKDKFAGVAMQASPAGEAGTVRVATLGVFEFDCDAATFEVGDLIAPTENGTSDGLMNQKVGSVASVTSALGRCAARANPARTRVLVDIVSAVMKGGAQDIL